MRHITATLAGRHVVVTRPRAQALAFADRLTTHGAQVTIVPAIAIAPAGDDGLRDTLARLDEYDRVIFTSANAVRAVLALLERAALPTVVAIGPETAAVLAGAGIASEPLPASADTEALIASLGDCGGQRILLPRSDLADDRLPDACRARGATVDAPVAYRTAAAPELDELVPLLRDQWVDAITLASASAARAVASVIVPARLLTGSEPPARPLIACIGPATASAARTAGLPVDLVASSHDSDGLIEGLIDWFAGTQPGY